jgi:rhamnosyltransferase
MVFAVVVTYHPELEQLARLLDALTPQVDAVVLVDNGSRVDVPSWCAGRAAPTVEVALLGENRGIAVAQNVGIAMARSVGAEYVLLMDQDSVPAPNMVEELVSAIRMKPLAAAAGPRYMDERQQNPPPFIRIEGIRMVRCTCPSSEVVRSVDYLIASGCLIPLSVLNEVGGMREDLFIDYVDIEWGLRARNKGFQSYGVCSAAMQHTLGDKPISFFGKSIPSHSPLRHYYHFRNAVILYREPWASMNWKIVDAWRLFLKYIFYSVFAAPRLAQWNMMTLGVWHGITRKMGRLHRA